MTHLEIRGLRESSWAINQVHLTQGYWVLLVGSEQIAAELARRLIGLDAPSKGVILLNGKEPFRSPATRANCVSLQLNEAPVPALTVRDAFSGAGHDLVDPLKSFGLEHLIDRTHETLSAQERRQLAVAATLARRSTELAVYCEPRLDLTAPQLARLQDHMSRLAPRACVLCITASLHDARLLGGPHAQLTRNGWTWVTAGGDSSATIELLIEGTGLRPVAAHLALQEAVIGVRMQLDGAGQVLHVTANAGSSVGSEVVRAARENRANVTRICTDEVLTTGDLLRNLPDRLPTEDSEQAVAGHTQVCNLVRMILIQQRELLAKTFLSGPGLMFFLGGPLITVAYAAGQRQLAAADALQNTLTFFVTYIVPLGTLLGVQFLNRNSALGALREPVARFGVNRRIVTSANLLVVGAACAVVSVASVASGVLLTNGTVNADLCTCAWIAALGASTYAVIFALLDLPRYRWVQWVYLIINVWVGASALGVAVLFPHAHLLNLLGSSRVPELAQPVSVACLGAMILLAFGLTLMRTET